MIDTLIHLYNALPDTPHYAVLHELDRVHALNLIARLFAHFGRPLFEDGTIGA